MTTHSGDFKGYEHQILSALGISWHSARKTGGKIHCPFPGHPDKNPSWRWADSETRWHCTCGGGDILDAIERMGKAQGYRECCDWARAALGMAKPAKPQPLKSNGAIKYSNGADTSSYQAATKAPTPEQLRHPTHGLPSNIATYYLADGQIAEIRARYDYEGGKEVVPWTLVGGRWTMKQMSGKRPLYRLRALLKQPDKPVLFVEGEGRKAERAQRLFPDHVVTATSGGCKAFAGMDYSPLKGRRIVVWPDNDKPGREYAENVCSRALEAGAIEARIVDVPGEWPQAWDLGDEPPSDAVDLREMLDEASAFAGDKAEKATNGHDPDPDAWRRPEPSGKGEGQGETGLKATTAAELLKKKAPERLWVVPDWIPDKTTTLFAGDGGIGKSVLAVQLLWACATGREWLGRSVKKCSVLYVSCEDDMDEIHFRLEKLHDNEPCATGLENLHIIDMVGEPDAEIATFQHDKLNFTDVYSKIDAYLQKHKIGLLVLDASADVFGGDEISKRQVRAFIRALNGLARKYACAIILIAHPSKSGMKDGTGYSGNVAWNGSVRARLYFEAVTPKNDDDDTEADSDRRVLRLPKSNRSRAGQKIYVRWKAKECRFVVDSADGVSIEQGVEDEALFLRILDQRTAEGRNSCIANGTSFAPNVFADHPLGKGVSRERFRHAMERLLSVGKIINQPEGPPSRRHYRLVRVEQ